MADLNIVDTQVLKMIKHCPAIFRTKMNVIGHILFSRDFEWDQDGNIVNVYPECKYDLYAPDSEDDDKDIIRLTKICEYSNKWDKKTNEAQLADRKLFIREYASNEQFVFDNAEILLKASPKIDVLPSSSNSRILDNVPDNASQEWLDVFAEYLKIAEGFVFDEAKYFSWSESYKHEEREKISKFIRQIPEMKIKLIGTEIEKNKIKEDFYKVSIQKIIEQATKDGVELDLSCFKSFSSKL